MQRLPAARVVLPTRVGGPSVVLVEGDRIVAVEATDDEVPDRTLVPGFVDLQVNGIAAVDVAAARNGDWDVLDAALLAQGVTTWCPTLVTAPLDAYASRLERVAGAAVRDGGGVRPLIAGAHLEGPFLGGAPGAHPEDLIRSPSVAWLQALPPVVRVMTIAPESDGAVDAITTLAGADVLVSLGHSAASYEQVGAAVDAGARLVTHCFNGMAPLHHREPGLVGAALTDDRLAASVIADFVHVHPAAVSLVFRAKGPDNVVLVTDSVAWERGTVGPVHMTLSPPRARQLRRGAAVAGHDDGIAPRLADGTLAGSALTMDTAIRNVVARCGVSLLDAVRAASTTPARLLGLDDRGAIEPGRRADLVALTSDLHVASTWVGGRADR